MKYEVILFDADETLFDFKKSERESFRKAMIDIGIEYDENYHFKIYHEINMRIIKIKPKGWDTDILNLILYII